MGKKKKIADRIWTVVLTILALLYVYPIIMILFNSLKKETTITTAGAFTLPTADGFAGLENYVNAIASKGFLQSLGYSLLITLTSVVAILICCSMCAWYITRVKGVISQGLYFLFVFSMVVPFPDGRPIESQYTVEHLGHLSGIWCRTCGLHVCGIHEIHSVGN